MDVISGPECGGIRHKFLMKTQKKLGLKGNYLYQPKIFFFIFPPKNRLSVSTFSTIIGSDNETLFAADL